MRFRPSRRGTLLAGAIGAVATVVALGFAPLVRAAAHSSAQRRHVSLAIGGVRPGWFAVHLLGVVVRPEAMPSVAARVDDIRVGLTLGFRVETIVLRGLSIEINGATDRVRDEWSHWRALLDGERVQPSRPSRAAPSVVLEGASFVFEDAASADTAFDIHGVDATWDAEGLRWKASSTRLRRDFVEVSMTDTDAAVDRAGNIAHARAAAAMVDLGHPNEDETNTRAPMSSAPSTTEPSRIPSPEAPFFPIPDTRAIRAKLLEISAVLAEHFSEAADVGVTALTWRIGRPREKALTLGPGPFSLERTSAGFELGYSSGPSAASTPLALRAAWPRAGDPAISLEGGPVSLSLLGVQEGAAGLVDVAHTTVTGRGKVVLAGDGSALTFDGEGGARGLSVASPRLALDVVRGVDLQLRARGTATAEGDLRVDDLSVSVGTLHIAAGGALHQVPDHVALALHFELPTTTCQSILDSLPSALLPALQGTRVAGDFGAVGRFGFDSNNIDALELEYDVRDKCRFRQVPAELERERFEQPFSRRIYLPDGTVADETTGPGTNNWTPLDEISPYMQVAVLTTEDGAFPRHHGFNRASIRQSLVANLKARRFARGASTITMQVAKNLFLSRDKTVSRKLEELVLTDYMEQTFSKDELMELYLNIIEFGPAVYGITAAAEHYFGRTPAELHLGECLFLSSLLPAPLRYGTMRDGDEVPESWMRVLRSLMQIARRNGRITDAELAEAEREPISFWHGGERPPPRPPIRLKLELERDTDDVITAPPLDVPMSP